MKRSRDQLLLSPSDLNAFLACEHLTALDIERAGGALEIADSEDAEAELRRTLGLVHEAAWRERFISEGKRVVDIPNVAGAENGWHASAEATAAAMREGADVIYQGVVLDDGWRGIADFVVRVDEPSTLGGWSYEAWDTKLGRHAKPTYALQLAFYTDQIAHLQGRLPSWMRVVLGHHQIERLKPEDFLAYYRRARQRLRRFTAQPRSTSAYPVEHCGICRYREHCGDMWRRADHLSLVAGIRRETAQRLEAAGVKTMSALAAATLRPDSRIGETTFAVLRDQARLQRSFVETRKHSYELIPPTEERGFALMPAPSPGDLFFDMEGYPYFEPTGGLEYLFGVAWRDGGRPQFRPWWGTDRAGEKAAFEGFIDFVRARLRDDPTLHVYHYASYERTKLGHLAQQHGTREEELDDLLRRQVFVDLYKVTRQALRTSHEGYSLKDVRQFFLADGPEDSTVATAGDSIVEFSKWLKRQDQTLLDAIERYNEEDCVSTLRLRDWLLERRSEAMARFSVDLPWRQAPAAAEKPVIETEDENADLRSALLATAASESESVARRLLAGLLDYHRREDKPEWWEYFARFDASTQELLEDPGAIVGLTPAGDPVPPVRPARSWTYPLSYPDQEQAFDVGDKPDDLHTEKPAGTVAEANHDNRSIALKFQGVPGARPLPTVIVASKPIDSKAQREAVRRVAEHFRGTTLSESERYGAVADLLLQRAPRLRGKAVGATVQTTDLAHQKDVVAALERSSLVIQGPPGSGKTWTGARLVVDRLKAGARVGVAALSHRAISNLLDEVERVAQSEGLMFTGLKKATSDRPDSVFESRSIRSETDLPVCRASGAQLLAGTAFFFPHLSEAELDYLFIDEAGQVSLGDAVAMGASSKNLVLLGDPQQLPHVTHGVHVNGAGASALGHYLAGAATVSEDKGMFLATTFRMHPNVCDFVSHLSYEGRLEADVTCGRQRVTSAGLDGTGLRYRAVDHRGNARLSVEEADVVARDVRELLRSGQFTDRFGRDRALTPADILVVAPYNMQRRCLRERLPAGVEVGTVDKFQGREAPVVFFSMATSSGDDIPRGVDFLFNKNRLNVAVSRARCLSVLVASPRLLEVPCHTLSQMRQVNALCAFVESALAHSS